MEEEGLHGMIYTDGGCYNNGDRKGDGSYAFFDADKATKEYVDIIAEYVTDTTNNRMEMMAVIQAIKYVMTNNLENERPTMTIVSDSGYLVKGYTDPAYLDRWIANGWKTASNKSVQNVDMWSEIHRLSWHAGFNFVHIRGHKKDKNETHAYWNDICDAACTYMLTKFKNDGFVVTLRYYFADKKFEVLRANIIDRKEIPF